MNGKIILAFIACIALTNAGVLKVENEDVTRSVLTDTINKAVESLKQGLAEYDPLTLSDKSVSVDELGDVTVGSAEASGFSDFTLTGLTANILTSTLTGTLSFPSVQADVKSAELTSETLGIDGSISALSADLSGATIDISLKYKLSPLQVTSLSVLPKVKSITLSGEGKLNGEAISVAVEDADVANSFLSKNQETISSVVLPVVNYLLGKLGSSFSELE